MVTLRKFSNAYYSYHDLYPNEGKSSFYGTQARASALARVAAQDRVPAQARVTVEARVVAQARMTTETRMAAQVRVAAKARVAASARVAILSVFNEKTRDGHTSLGFLQSESTYVYTMPS